MHECIYVKCMYINRCVYICKYVCMCICKYVCMSVCLCMHVCICVCMNVCMNILKCMCVYAGILCMYVRMHIYILKLKCV